MALFLSSYENRIDTRGRVSVPASYRIALNNEDFTGVVLYRSFTNKCIEGLSMSRMEQLAASADTMGLGNDLDELSARIFANARPLQFDVTGRIVIPKDLLKHAGIQETALFVGRGNSFQIWNPAEFNAAQETLPKKTRGNRQNVKI